MSADRKSFALRLDPALYNAVARLAAGDLRSINAEIEFLLREAVKRRGVAVEPTEDEGGENDEGA